jgi:hypothetical protein
MQRRKWLFGAPAVVLGLSWGSIAPAQVVCAPPAPSPTPTSGGIDAVAEIKALRIPSGPYKGGYELAPNGKLNWYFANLGLLPLVRVLSAADLDTHVRTYLDLYLANLEPNGSIQDIDLPFGRANPSVFKKVLADSDDAYAATLLSLASRYVVASGNWTWWEANKTKLKNMAYRNLALTAKPSGLTSVFQAPRSQTNSIGYLMDNCEGYRGLRDFAAVLRSRSELLDANYYDLLATNAAQGIKNLLYHLNTKSFLASDASAVPGKVFYPDTSCQVYPQVFGVTELEPLFVNGWTYLNSNSPGWETGKYDPFPWAVLGYTAALRGQTVQARSQLVAIEKTFVANRSLVTVNELGFYLRTRAVLDGVPNA